MMGKLTPEKFRQALAGFTDAAIINISDKENIKNEAIRYCSILASLFGSDLDRMTLWDKIGTSIESAGMKSKTDIEQFMNYCLDSIQAEHSRVASSESLLSIIQSWNSKPESWKIQLIQYLTKNKFTVLIFARERWNEFKEGKIEL